MPETDLYLPVKRHLEAQGYTVKAEVKGCDAVATRGTEVPVIIELKQSLTLALLYQAVDETWGRSADFPRGSGTNLGPVSVQAGGSLAPGNSSIGKLTLNNSLSLDAAALSRLDTAARAACLPIDDKRGTVAYRIHVAGVLARRAATIAYQRALARSAQESST